MNGKVILRLQSVSKSFSGQQLLNALDLSIQSREIHAIMGRSGVGKSTLLKIMSGLIAADSGEVLFHEVPLENPEELLIAGHEELAYMAQDFRLLKNRTVAENLKDALLPFENPFAEKQQRSLLELMRLETLANKRIESLSGGEKQRLAIARTMASQPEVLLLDEPFTQLDKATRQVLMDALSSLRVEWSTTIIFVTHDVNEAFYLADTIHFLEKAKFMQSGSPSEVYKMPKNVHVANLMGLFNQIPAELLDSDSNQLQGRASSYGIWPENVKILNGRRGDENPDFILKAEVMTVNFMGAYFLLKVLITEGMPLYVVSSQFSGSAGQKISLGINSSDLIALGH